MQKCIHHCSSFHRLANEALESLSNHWNEVPGATIGSALQSYVVTGPPLKTAFIMEKRKREPTGLCRALHYSNCLLANLLWKSVERKQLTIVANHITKLPRIRYFRVSNNDIGMSKLKNYHFRLQNVLQKVSLVEF